MTNPAQMNCAHSPDGWCFACVSKVIAERDELETECAVHAACTKARVEQLAAVSKERDELRKDAERWNTVETLWFESGEPLELGTDDDGLALVVFDGAECAGAVWRGNSLEDAIDNVTAAIAKVQPSIDATLGEG